MVGNWHCVERLREIEVTPFYRRSHKTLHFQSNLFVTQNYTIPIKDGKIEQCVNRTQRQLRAGLTGAQTDIYGKS